MSLIPGQRCERDVLAVAVVHGGTSSFDGKTYLPAGHCLSRARVRHLLESDWVIVTNVSVPVGLAAYKPAHSDVRVVHELLLDRTLSVDHAAKVTDALIVALEMLACDEGVDCLMFWIYGEVVTARFDAHGYNRIVADRCGSWLQKKLDSLTWSHHSPGRAC